MLAAVQIASVLPVGGSTSIQMLPLPTETAAQADAEADSCCAACGEQDVEGLELVLSWIRCDSCMRWFHGECAGLTKVGAAELSAGVVWAWGRGVLLIS